MNDELKEKLMHYLETIEKGVNQGADFVAEQAPLYVQEFLAWEFWQHCISAIAFALAIIVILALGWNFSAMMKNSKNREANDMRLAPLVASLLLAGILLPILIFEVKQALKVELAPRVVIVESLRKAMK
jgi:hypothetical protein